MNETAVEVTCRRRSGQWEITVPQAPDLALVVERLEDVPHVVKQALVRHVSFADDDIRVLLDVRGS